MMDQEYETMSPPGSPAGRSTGSSNLSAKQYFCVNLSKFVIELIGTAFVTMFFYMMSGRFTSMFMAMWIITLFGLNISGAHFNPAVTVAQMLRKKTTFGKRRLLGVIYLIAQFSGGILGATAIATLLKEGSDYRINVMPASNECEYKDWAHEDDSQSYNKRKIDCRYDIPTDEKDEDGNVVNDEDGNPKVVFEDNPNKHWKTVESVVSETFGTFIYVLFFMISTDEKLRFSSDKVHNALVIASSYITSQLLAGGQYVTVVTGPCLNPAAAFGLALLQANFSFPQYMLCPFLGSILALAFYEIIFVKTQEYLNDESEEEEDDEEEENEDMIDKTSKDKDVEQETLSDE